MNILMLLTPKKDVRFLTTNLTIQQALNLLKRVRFNSVPLLDTEGYYIGTITEGDLLWHLAEHGDKAIDTTKIKDVERHRDYGPVTINASMDDLIQVSLGQNFIPILDDRRFFIGIVTRKDLLNDFIFKAHKKAEVISKNPVLDTIYKRRSIRKFKEDDIAKEVIDEILNAGLVSPTARNRRPLHMMLITDKRIIGDLSTTHRKGGHFEKVPYLILVLTDLGKEEDHYNAISNTGGAIMSMLLAIESYDNLGGFWIGCGQKEINDAFLTHLQVPSEYRLFGMIGFGVKDEFKPANEPINDNKIHINKW